MCPTQHPPATSPWYSLKRSGPERQSKGELKLSDRTEGPSCDFQRNRRDRSVLPRFDLERAFPPPAILSLAQWRNSTSTGRGTVHQQSECGCPEVTWHASVKRSHWLRECLSDGHNTDTTHCRTHRVNCHGLQNFSVELSVLAASLNAD